MVIQNTTLGKSGLTGIVFDLPQIHTKPSATKLLDSLSLLSLEPRSWEGTPPLTPGTNTPRSASGATTPAFRAKRRVNPDGVPQYLTKIISSPLAWIKDDIEKEHIWDVASVRLSERSGRTGMGAISRTFRIPTAKEPTNSGSTLQRVISTSEVPDEPVDIEIHEPALTADNLGLKTWASSFVLARKWHTLRDDIPLRSVPEKSDHRSATILELGAGTGLVGIAAAAVLKTSVILTDLPEIVTNLERNIRSNDDAISSRGGSARAAILDWTEPENFPDSEESGFPLIVAADPIYSAEHPKLLAQTVKCHLSKERSARVVVEMPIREAYSPERDDFKAKMQEIGLVMIKEDTETGYDDWSEGRGEELKEVECWMSIWAWKEPQ